MRNRLLVSAVLVLLSLVHSQAASGQPSQGVADAAIIATNSVDLDRNVAVTGNVVVNQASPGPTLDGGVELNVDKVNTFGVRTASGDLKADSVALNKFAAIAGTVFYNELFDQGATVGGFSTPLGLPVFQVLPAFQSAMLNPGVPDVFVGAGESATIGESNYGDIDVGSGGTLTVAGGVYNVRSITIGQDANLLFESGADIRVEGRLSTGKNSFVGAAPGATVTASRVVIYVGGINGGGGGLFEPPLAAAIGRESAFFGNVYAPQGTISVGRTTQVTGGLIARDVWMQTGATILVASFVNQRPTADPIDVFTADQASVDIPLSGSDPNDDPLSFSIATLPTTGMLTDSNDYEIQAGDLPYTLPTPTVTFTPDDPSANLEDSFDYTVTDPGMLSDTATVQINPPGDPVVQCEDDNDCDPGQTCNTVAGICELASVVANDQLCESVEVEPGVFADQCDLETTSGGSGISIILTGTAPCEGGFPTPPGDPNDVEPCDGNGNDVPLTFSLPSMTTSAGGTLSGLNQGTGELQEPPGPDEVPQRTASLLYTPPSGFTGVDSFSFDVEGDVDDSGGIGGANETDTGTVEISVQAFTPIPPVQARDQIVSTEVDTPVLISLSGPAGTCDPNDPDCRTAPAAPESPTAGPSAISAPTVVVTDDTGAAPPPAKVVTQASSVPVPGTRAAVPGEQLFAIDSDLDKLFELDPTSGNSTPVGSTLAGPTTPASLAFDGTDMYTIDLGGGGLYKLNLKTGVPTLACSTGISGWQGLASDPTSGGQLYGITQSDDLYAIDRTTCTTTHVNANAPGTVGGLIAALEFDANGTLWGAEFGSPGSSGQTPAALVTIDKTTGVVTTVSGCATYPCSGNDNFADGFQGIDFSTDGTLYGSNSNDDSLYIIDTTDGSLTLLGANATIFVKGLAFGEEVTLVQSGFTVLTLPAVGTLSYVEPVTGQTTNIVEDDLPLLLPTEQVTYTPPAGATAEASFTFEQSDGLTSDTGTVSLVVTGVIVIVDSCAQVGRPPGCEAGGDAGATGGGGEEEGTGAEGESGANLNLQVAVIGDGSGTITSSRRQRATGSLPGLSCDGRCGMQFDDGREVVLYARPIGDDSEFVRWGGDCAGSEAVTRIVVHRRTRCTAEFTRK